jgi:hypothetical protein
MEERSKPSLLEMTKVRPPAEAMKLRRKPCTHLPDGPPADTAKRAQ